MLPIAPHISIPLSKGLRWYSYFAFAARSLWPCVPRASPDFSCFSRFPAAFHPPTRAGCPSSAFYGSILRVNHNADLPSSSFVPIVPVRTSCPGRSFHDLCLLSPCLRLSMPSVTVFPFRASKVDYKLSHFCPPSRALFSHNDTPGHVHGDFLEQSVSAVLPLLLSYSIGSPPLLPLGCCPSRQPLLPNQRSVLRVPLYTTRSERWTPVLTFISARLDAAIRLHSSCHPPRP